MDKERFKAWLKKDFIYIVLLLFALLSNLLTWYSYQDKQIENIINVVNDKWIEQVKIAGCWKYFNTTIGEKNINPEYQLNISRKYLNIS